VKPLVKILYEDQQAEDATNFGPHVLVLRCLLDRLGWPEERYFELQRHMSGQPRKGDKKLLAACLPERQRSEEIPSRICRVRCRQGSLDRAAAAEPGCMQAADKGSYLQHEPVPCPTHGRSA